MITADAIGGGSSAIRSTPSEVVIKRKVLLNFPVRCFEGPLNPTDFIETRLISMLIETNMGPTPFDSRSHRPALSFLVIPGRKRAALEGG